MLRRMATAASVLALAVGTILVTPGTAGAATFNVRDFGATGNGSSNDTPAIQRAIEAASAAGGGTVWFPPGTYQSRNTIHLRSDITMQFDAGATLRGASNDDYDPPEPNEWDEYQDFGHSHFRNSMIFGDRVSNVAFVGGGVIDGGGHLITGNPDPGEADKIITLTRCNGLNVGDGLTLRRGGHFAMLINGCTNVTSDRLRIDTASDRDGWNVISTTNVRITNADISANDDALAFKSDYALGAKLPNGNVTVTDSRLAAVCCNALMFGSETCGDFTGYDFQRISINGSNKSGLGMVSMDGTVISDVHYRDITMTNVRSAIMQKVGTRRRCGNNPGVGRIHDVTYENIRSTGQSSANFTATLWGESGTDNKISDITFTNVDLTVPGGSSSDSTSVPSNDPNNYNPNSIGTRPAYGWYLRNVDGVKFVDSGVEFNSGDSRAAVIANNSTNVTFERLTAERSNGPRDLVFQNVSGFCVRDSGSPRVSQTGSTESCTSTPTNRFEAENGVCQGTIDSNHAGFSGTGFCNTDNAAGAGLTWTVSSATGGAANATIRYANGTAENRPLDVWVNGVVAAEAVAFNPTGAWTTWQTVTLPVSLNAGSNTTPVQPAAAAPLAFSHPGVLVRRAQLDTMRQKVNEGAEPWATAYQAMRSSNFAALSWTAKPRAIVECGPSSNPNLGCSDERNDAIAAYTHALMWSITRDTRHAQKSAQIMDAWSAVIKDHTNHNARLQTGWAGASWTRAAELIRHTSSVWPADRVNRFATMLRDVYLPEIRDAMIGIYLRTDGQYPKSPPGSNKDTPAELIDYWQDQSTFVDDLAQETCRDFGHTGWGFEAAAHVAETAWHQGIDLYSEMRERMTKALEFHANYELGASVPSWLCGGSLDTGLGATGEVAHNHYRNRTDTRLPKTLQVIQTRRWMGVSHFIAWETPTHATNPGVATTAATARVITVSSISQLQSAADQAQPGDRIELVDGTYTTSGPITLRRSGSSTEPITIAAQRVGGAEIRGSAGFSFAGVDNVAVSGLRLTHGGSISIPADSHHVRFSRNVVRLTSGGNWLTVVGNDVEVDRNTFQNKSNQGVFLQISGPGDAGMAQRSWVHHNYFADHTFSGENGGESIRLGLSFRQLSSARATVEHNLFERTDGDSEAISVKSADNTIRFNTLRDSRGSIVLRHGNRNLVEGNLMLGNTAGIRFYDNDHVIINNVLQGGTGQIIAGSGTIADDTTGSTAHARPDRVVVAFNTVVGSRTNLLQVGQGTDRLGPNDCTFANNIFVGGGSGALLDIDEATGARWQGNIVWAGTGGNAPSSGYRVVNPGLVTDSGGLRRLAAGSPAIDSAAGSFSQVSRDLDLQNRSGAKDVGADEFLTGGSQRRPLTTADVGPNS